MKKTALVLSGGGFKGAFQVGALDYLRENWDQIAPDRPPLSFDIVAGVSVGSLNGLLVALGRFDELQQLWNDVAENGVGGDLDLGLHRHHGRPQQRRPTPQTQPELGCDQAALPRHDQERLPAGPLQPQGPAAVLRGGLPELPLLRRQHPPAAQARPAGQA